jgi:RimJ/RimL family protein N-acetyltransferase
MTGAAGFGTIGTDRLLMRRWLESDREPFAALNADPQTMWFFPRRSTGLPVTRLLTGSSRGLTS